MAKNNIEEYQFKKGRSSEEAAAAGKLGGKASGESRRKRKTLRELAIMLGNMPAKSDVSKALLEQAGVEDPEVMTNNSAMIVALQLKANTGDVQAAKLLAQLQGESLDKMELTGADGGAIEVTNKVNLDDVIEALKGKD